MSCTRCQGLMVPDHPFRFITMLDTMEQDYTPPGDCPQRCIQCGNIVDARILANRAAQIEAGLRQILRDHDQQVHAS